MSALFSALKCYELQCHELKRGNGKSIVDFLMETSSFLSGIVHCHVDYGRVFSGISGGAQAVSALPVVGISTALLTYVALGYSLEADVVAMTVAYFDAWRMSE